MIVSPSCGITNPSEARFCRDCGAPLALACPSCDAEVPADKRFCHSYGLPSKRLRQASGSQPPTSRTKSAKSSSRSRFSTTR
ncbi:MAG: double zinc ribbon domain-containing protein [Acidimicrobiia bacterium]